MSFPFNEAGLPVILPPVYPNPDCYIIKLILNYKLKVILIYFNFLKNILKKRKIKPLEFINK